jgi:hypothetical protein
MNDEFDESFLSKTKFSKLVEDTSRQLKISYIDSVVYICEQNNLEIEDVKKYLSNVVKSKIEAEAMKLNYLPRGNTLPID